MGIKNHIVDFKRLVDAQIISRHYFHIKTD